LLIQLPALELLRARLLEVPLVTVAALEIMCAGAAAMTREDREYRVSVGSGNCNGYFACYKAKVAFGYNACNTVAAIMTMMDFLFCCSSFIILHHQVRNPIAF
jgi:hypothetical protein